MPQDGRVVEPREDQVPMTARASLARWALGIVLAVGAVVLLLKPGGISKLLGLALAAAAVSALARRDRSSATILAIALGLIAAFFLLAFLTGNSAWITDRYTR